MSDPKTPVKLELDVETIRELTVEELGSVAGGTATTAITCTCAPPTGHCTAWCTARCTAHCTLRCTTAPTCTA